VRLWFVVQNGCTALLLASANGRTDVVKWLVTEMGCDARSERDNVLRLECCACVV
jgi:hypothetical protein